jgi:hypothetical protein
MHQESNGRSTGWTVVRSWCVRRALSVLTLAVMAACRATDATRPPDAANGSDGSNPPDAANQVDAGNPPDAPSSPADGPKRVFVTSAVYQGGLLGGLSGADAKCAAHAKAAGLSGTFKAWLSDDTTAAADRLTHSRDEYTLLSGTRVGDNWDDLVHASLQHAINVDENGTQVPPPSDPMIGGAVWTGTDFDARPYMDPFNADRTCGGWSDLRGVGLCGDYRSSAASWTINVGLPCTFKAALYCIEQ